jgi:expansin (peptidoglycan-binding protein)
MALQPKPQAFSGEATFYGGGAGSCGGRHSAEELTAALPASMYDGPKATRGKNVNCGRKIRVDRAGKTVVVTVVDRCAGCKYGDLDLSRAAFAQLASLREGRIEITWEFVG